MDFGRLTLSVSEDENYLRPIDYLFRYSQKGLETLTVIEAERQTAFENLKKLTTELQTKRLRYNAKSVCKYFTL